MKTLTTSLLTMSALISGGVAYADDVTPGLQCELQFRFDSSVTPANARDQLTRVATRAAAHPELRIVLDGYTDPTGSGPYNVGLSIRRSQAVRAQLVALGVDDSRIVIAAYGEDGARRASHADDRRVSVWTTTGSVGSIIAHTFDSRGTAIKWERPMTMAQIDRSVPIASR